MLKILTLKAPITTAADNNFIFFYFSKKTGIDISCELCAKQTNHMKCQDLFFCCFFFFFFFLKNIYIYKIECRLLQILLGALRINIFFEEIVFRVELSHLLAASACTMFISMASEEKFNLTVTDFFFF